MGVPADNLSKSIGGFFKQAANNFLFRFLRMTDDGSAVVYGLGRRQIQVGAGVYNTTEILGFEVYNVGSSGNWSWTAVEGGVATIAFGDMTKGIRPTHCSTITVPTGGIAVLWIPGA